MRISLIKFKQSHALFVASLIALLIALVSYFLILPFFPTNTNNNVAPTALISVQSEANKEITASLYSKATMPDHLDDNINVAIKSNEVTRIDKFNIDELNIPTCSNTTETNQEELNTKLEQLIEQNRVSASIDDQFIYHLTMFSPTSSEHIDFYHQYVNQAQNKPIAYYHLLNACHEQSNNEICQDELLEQANTIDAENGMLWLNIAGIKLKQGDNEAALTAIRTASEKTVFSEYHFQTIDLIASNIQLNTPVEYKDAVISAIGYVAAQPAMYGGVLKLCLNSEVTDIEQADVCHQLGQSMANNSDTLLLSSFGSSFQQEYLRKHQNTEAALASKQDSDNLYRAHFNEHSFKLSALAFNNEQLIREWLSMGKISGESSANVHMINELKWLLSNKDYNPCTAQVVQ